MVDWAKGEMILLVYTSLQKIMAVLSFSQAGFSLFPASQSILSLPVCPQALPVHLCQLRSQGICLGDRIELMTRSDPVQDR